LDFRPKLILCTTLSHWLKRMLNSASWERTCS
jgi:hypothetical protein